MKSRETVRHMSAGQMKEIASALVEGIPTDLPPDLVQYWIGNKHELGQAIRRVLERQDAGPVRWEIARNKLLRDVRASDIPRGLSAEDIAIPEGLGAIQEIDVNYDDPVWRTIQPSRYTHVHNEFLKHGEWYYAGKKGQQRIRFRLLPFLHHPNAQDLIERLSSEHCDQPNLAEAETIIRSLTSGQLSEHPVVGVIDRNRVVEGARVSFVLGHGQGVSLMNWWFRRDRWSPAHLFIGICR